MGLGLKIDPEQRLQILAEICDRNQSGTLVHQEPGKPASRARTRFLEWDGDTIHIDNPTAGAQPLVVRPGEHVTIYFHWEDQRLGFSTQVTGRGKWRDGSLETLALQLRVPEKIVKAQRRECYRLSLVHIPDAVIQFDSADGATPPWSGILVDVSETGGGVIVEKDEAPNVRPRDEFIAAFGLPGFDYPIIVPCEVRWQQDTKEGDRFRMGVQWRLDENSHEDRNLQKDLARFIASEQAELLRRQRDKGK
jgi:c-di-GMP-binding flagellar brake protein YcgR